MKWHTSGGSVGPCMCAQSWYYFFLVIYMFLTLISSNDRNFRMQLNFSKELHSNSWFFSRASIKDRELDYKLYWAWLFNKTIQQKQYYHASLAFEKFCSTIFLVVLISHPQLNWISGRKLEKLASGTWSLHTIVLYELFMRFSEKQICISLWIDSIPGKYALSHLVKD